MTNKLKIYTAGEMGECFHGNHDTKNPDDWRNKLVGMCGIENKYIEWLHPTIYGCDHRGIDPSATVEKDISMLSDSDVVVAYLNRSELYGTITEIMYAVQHNKKLILVIDSLKLSGVNSNDMMGGNTKPLYTLLKTNHTCGCMFQADFLCNQYWFLLCFLIDYHVSQIVLATKMKEVPEMMMFYFDKKIQEELEQSHLFLDSLSPFERADIILDSQPLTKTIHIFKRNKTLINPLKQLYNNECQICGFTFTKTNGAKYSETHHLISLGQQGADALHNLVVLCPNCHRKMHYASVSFNELKDNKLNIRINGDTLCIVYKKEHFDLLNAVIK